MIKQLRNLVSSRKGEESNVLTRLISHPHSREGRQFLERAAREANERQRKIYYGDAKKSKA